MFKEGRVQKVFIAVLMSLLLFALSCGKDKDTGTKKTAAKKEIVFISDPSYLFAAVTAVYPSIQWSKYLDKGNSKSDFTDKYSQAMNLGSQIIDCLVAIQSKDFTTAEAIAKSMKQLSDKLNIATKIENKAVELEDSIKSKADVKSRKNIEELKALVVKALEELSGQDLDIALQYGAWLTSYSKVAKIASDKYDKNGATLLCQKTEIDYFLEKLQQGKFKDKESVKKSISFLTSLKGLVYVKTNKGELVAKDKPAKIAAESSEILKMAREGK